MAPVDDPKTLGRARLTFGDAAEIDEFVSILQQFEDGEITPDQWRAFRLLRGTYGQRQSDVQMIRVKIPQGLLTVEQLHALADVAERHSRGFGHITTRQNLQFHFVRLPEVATVLDIVQKAGLTTREACGNSVRNITACPYAGVSAEEAFDITPYSEALTRYLLRHPLSASLPRKFKIAFEGCVHDHALTAINDIGWRAKVRETDGRAVRGFQVTIGGGTATMTRAGYELFAFEPTGEMFNVAEAVIRVYHRLGDYAHKNRNRMKFLIKSLGWEKFREEVLHTLAEIRAEGGHPLPFDPQAPPEETEPDWIRSAAPLPEETAARAARSTVRGPGIVPDVRPVLAFNEDAYDAWRRSNVRPQKQPGYAIVTVTVPLGDLTAAQFRLLAELSQAFGDGTVRVTPEQDLSFRWVPVDRIRELFQQISAAGLGLAHAGTIADVTSCPGAESCRLAVTQSRGLGKELETHLRARPDLIAAAPDVVIKMSGCPNGCGQHHIANIGFQGSIRKVDDRAVPQYFVMVGGGVSTEGTSFGRVAAKIPARRIPQVVERVLDLYQRAHLPGETASAFLGRVELADVKAALADLERLDAAAATTEDFIDLGEDHAFAPEVMDGECAS